MIAGLPEHSWQKEMLGALARALVAVSCAFASSFVSKMYGNLTVHLQLPQVNLQRYFVSAASCLLGALS